ncbi:MAG: DUF4157 domain-containing protein [Ilumatobacteraceae bacterium]
MRVHDHESIDAPRRHRTVERTPDVDGQAARMAAAAGHVRGVETAAVLRLQRMAGNAGVGALMDGDPEQEAPRSPVLDVVGNGGGSPMRSDLRVQMEQGLGADFGDVRIHDDGAAAASARAVEAKAYTVGTDVVFGSGAYQPDTPEGRHTLAHELTHVVQQRSGPVDGTSTGDGIALSDPSDRFEREAEANASAYDHAAPPVAATATTGAAVQREGTDDELHDEATQAMTAQREEADEEVPEETTQTMTAQREGMDEEEPETQTMSAQAMHVQTMALQRHGDHDDA